MLRSHFQPSHVGLIRAIAVSMVALVALAGFLLASTQGSSRPSNSDRFWGLLSVNGVEAEWYESMAEMRDSSDAVVIASALSFTEGRTFGSADGGAAYFGVLSLSVEHVITGSAPFTVQLEVATPERSVLDSLSAVVPTERAIYFLRNKGTSARLWGPPPGSSAAAESQFWRLVNSQGLYREVAGKVVAPVRVETKFAGLADGRPFDDFADSIPTMKP